MGVTGLYTVDVAIVQEFVPAYKRGWVTGLTTESVAGGHAAGRSGRARIWNHPSAGAACSWWA